MKRRPQTPTPLARLRTAHLQRVGRATRKIEAGFTARGDLAADLAPFVIAELDAMDDRLGRPRGTPRPNENPDGSRKGPRPSPTRTVRGGKKEPK